MDLNFLNDNTDYNNNKPIEDADFFIKNLKGEKNDVTIINHLKMLIFFLII